MTFTSRYITSVPLYLGRTETVAHVRRHACARTHAYVRVLCSTRVNAYNETNRFASNEPDRFWRRRLLGMRLHVHDFIRATNYPISSVISCLQMLRIAITKNVDLYLSHLSL